MTPDDSAWVGRSQISCCALEFSIDSHLSFGRVLSREMTCWDSCFEKCTHYIWNGVRMDVERSLGN